MPAGARVENRRSDRAALLSCTLVLALAALGCNIDNPGDPPAQGSLYFPNAVALSREPGGGPPRWLFVANSNFDLRFRSGSLQAFSLDRLQQAVDRCRAQPNCSEIATDEVLDPDDQLSIGSFSTSLAASPDGRFLFATTRTDDSLAFIPLNTGADGGAFDCGGDRGSCVHYARRGNDPEQSDEQLDWPPDPAAVTSGAIADWPTAAELTQADTSGMYALVAHRSGSVSLFLQRGDDFELTDVLTGLPPALTNIEFDPATKLAYITIGTAGLARVGVALAESENGELLGSLFDAGLVQLEATSPTPSTRDLRFLPALENAGASLAETSALVVAQIPSALLLVDLNEGLAPPASLRVKRTAVVGFGASRLAVGTLGGRPTAVVACFEARELFVIDLITMLPRSVVPNLSGPYEIALDEQRQLLYVADFRSSVIRIVDLAPIVAGDGEAPAKVVATLGEPQVLQELK